MAGVCSWCGTELVKVSEKADFLCSPCVEKAEQEECLEAVSKRGWRPWMPELPYPRLDRGDTRR